MRTARIVMPKAAKKGDIVEIKTLITHPMETGYRRDDVGKAVPRDIIGLFTVTYAGTEVFRMDLFPGIAANPFVAFTTVATETGELVFTWTDEKGEVHVERATLTVT
jgi:sulfur-oxidizing protein SoxZ